MAFIQNNRTDSSVSQLCSALNFPRSTDYKALVRVPSNKHKEYETLTVRYEKAKSRLDEVEAEIHDKNSRRKSIEHYLALLEECEDAVTEYDVRLWYGMVEFVTVYSKDDILFTMKDGTEIRV